MRILKYMVFLVAILAFMVFLGHEETLSPEETLAIAEFQKYVANEAKNNVANTKEAVASETHSTGQNPSSNTIASNKPHSLLDQTIPNGTVLEDSLNVRSGPGLDYPVVTQLYKGDAVIIGENHSGWYELLLDGLIFYISAEYVTLSPVQ